jgi:hypothetical protein
MASPSPSSRRPPSSGPLASRAPLPPGLLVSSSMDLALLDFRSGLAFEDSLRLNLTSSVCPARLCLRSSFWLVVSFGRCIFKLNSDSIGHLLQAALGGFASGFEVLQLADRVFRFSVSSMVVGFHIYNSRCIDRKEFRTFFNLWNQGGPNWRQEFKIFTDEETASWLDVRGRKRLSFADIVKLPLTGANVVPIRSNIKFSGGDEHQAHTRISAFNRMGSPSRNLAPVRSDKRFSAGGTHQPRFRISAFNRLGLPAPRSWSSSSQRRAVSPRFSNSRRVSSSLLFPDPIGEVHGGRIRDCYKFQNSNFNWSRTRNLQWRPVRVRGPAGPLGPPVFRCHFCKVRGHLELFCPSKKSSFGFPLASFPAFGSRAILVGNRKSLDHSTWFRSPVVSLIGGPLAIVASRSSPGRY